MPAVPLTSPFNLKNATMTIDTDDFTAAVTQVEFSPSVSANSVRTIDGVVHRDQSTAEWSCTIGFVQDLDPDGLLRYLLDHDGEAKAASFKPVTGGPTITATLLISPGGIGGTGGEGLATTTANLAVNGKPEFTDPA